MAQQTQSRLQTNYREKVVPDLMQKSATRPPVEDPSRAVKMPVALPVGAGLGFLAGLTGIMAVVLFLTPLLIFLHWTPAKVAGGTSALFIVVNSIAGLVGLGGRALVWQPAFAAAVAAGVVGALIGTHCGVTRWRTVTFRRALAVVLWIAAGKLLLTGT